MLMYNVVKLLLCYVISYKYVQQRYKYLDQYMSFSVIFEYNDMLHHNYLDYNTIHKVENIFEDYLVIFYLL